MSFNFGKSSSEQRGGGTQTLQLPAASPEEQELNKLNLELAKRQLAQQDKLVAQQAQFEASPLAAQQKELEAAATANLLARVTGRSPVLSPEAQQRVGTAFGAAKARGLEDLTRLANETAAMRGLTRADSPIAAPFLQESSRFLQGLEGTRAGAELDVGNTEAMFNQSIADFQNRLAQQAFLNRLQLSGQAPASFGLAQNLFGQRLAAAPQSFTTFGNTSGTQFGGGINLNPSWAPGSGLTIGPQYRGLG